MDGDGRGCGGQEGLGVVGLNLGDSGSSPEWQPARVEPEEWQGRSPEWQRQQGLVLGRFGSRPAPG
jgi:hypothetical protein